MKTFIRMLNDNSGAAAAEYALILAIIGSGIALAAWNLGVSIKNSMDAAGACVEKQAGTSTAPTGC